MAPHSDMRAEVLEPCREDQGTTYPTTQAELDFHQASKFRSRSKGSFVIPIQATTELIRHNDPKRQVPDEEQAAIDRLLSLVKDVEGGCKWGPDIAIKCFADLDLVLFGGKLRGNVRVKWLPCEKVRRYRFLRVHKTFGLTEHPRIFERGRCCIVLNTDTLLSDDRSLVWFRAMFSTLLHEMCHAYEHVMCPRHWLSIGGEDAHGETFCSRITAVHRRAEQILRLEAIGYWEPYMRPHALANKDDEGYLVCGEGQVMQDGGKTDLDRWSKAHVRSALNGGSKRLG